jgi:hypothetical protein
MGWTLDNVLTICELTVFHPITSTLVLGATILFQTYVRPIKFENDFSVIESIWPLSIQTKITLGCAMISWILQLNQIGNRKALNQPYCVPGPRSSSSLLEDRAVLVASWSKGLKDSGQQWQSWTWYRQPSKLVSISRF